MKLPQDYKLWLGLFVQYSKAFRRVSFQLSEFEMARDFVPVKASLGMHLVEQGCHHDNEFSYCIWILAGELGLCKAKESLKCLPRSTS
eukprot:2599078-Amphidinium_carterae.2